MDGATSRSVPGTESGTFDHGGLLVTTLRIGRFIGDRIRDNGRLFKMKLLIGSILASLILIAIAAAAPVQAQFPAWGSFPGGQPANPGFGFQQVQDLGPPVRGGIPTLPQPGQSVFRAADDYLHAVEHFSEEASRVRTIDRFSQRLIGRLADQAVHVRQSARRLNDIERLIYEFNEIESLQPRVESAVFATGGPIIQAALGPCWNEVQMAFAVLSQSIQQVQVPAYSSSFGSRPGCGPGVSPFVDPRSSFRVPPVGFQQPGWNQPGFGQVGFGSRQAASIDVRIPVQPLVPVPPQFQPRRGNDLGSAILGGILSRVARGL